MSKGYLIDTDIMIDYFKGKYALNEKFAEVGLSNCFLSEITIAELYFGSLKSKRPQHHLDNLEKAKQKFEVIPISSIIEAYCRERLRLEKNGTPLPNFDLLIATTSVDNELTLVTGNVKHHSRVQNIVIENWRKMKFNSYLQTQ
ncbi:MAG: PIN domain-containing protein [Bacteroidota bacterium]